MEHLRLLCPLATLRQRRYRRADGERHERGEDEAELSGGVEIRYKNIVFRADRVVVHRDTMTVEAEGDVILEAGQCHVLTRAGLTLVTALDAASLRIVEPAPMPMRGLMAWLRETLVRRPRAAGFWRLAAERRAIWCAPPGNTATSNSTESTSPGRCWRARGAPSCAKA